jgi:hypothetical protein
MNQPQLDSVTHPRWGRAGAARPAIRRFTARRSLV